MAIRTCTKLLEKWQKVMARIVDQQKKVLQSHVFEKNLRNKKTKIKVSNYVFNPLLRSIVHHTGTSKTDLMYNFGLFFIIWR